MQHLVRGFQDIRKTTKMVAEISAQFMERSLLILKYTMDKEMKKTRYHSMLRNDIREFVIFLTCYTLEDMIDRARTRRLN